MFTKRIFFILQSTKYFNERKLIIKQEEKKEMQTQEYIFIVFAFIGGFGMFLYGMHIMAEGLQKKALVIK